MHRPRWLAAAVYAGALFLGCQDFLPANVYDPAAPASEQKAASLQVSVRLQDSRLSEDQTRAELEALTVRLTGYEPAVVKTARCDGDGAAVLEAACDAGAHTAQVRLRDLRPGRFDLEIQGVDPRYLPPAIPAIALLPGEDRILGTLTFVAPSLDSEPRTGRVLGEVGLSSGSGGAPRVELYQLLGGRPSLVTAVYADGQGRFEFSQLSPGTYALAAELERFTPDYRAGFAIQRAVAEEQNTVRFEGSDGMILHPVSAVLIPALQQTFGQYYTSGDAAPVQVLQFGGMNQMRVATEEGFANGTPTWLPYAASVDVDLPAREGEVRVLAQFRNTASADFEFETGFYEARLIRDVTPPQVVATSLRGRTPGAQGRTWIAQDAAVVAVDVDAQDAVSAVYGLALYHDAAGSAGDPASLTFTLLDAPAGLIRLDAELGLTAGDGEKKVFVYLRDRAGNTSSPVSLSAWVDTAPPAVQLQLPGAITGSALVPVRVAASDDHGVVSMQIWEEGQPVPAPVPLAEQWTVQLAPLDYASTTRQINAVVNDVAGNSSAPFAGTLTFDDRGSLAGLLHVEDATDGSAGDAAGVVALVNSQSFAAQFSAGGGRGDFDFVVPAIPAADNLQLVLQKAGYGEVRTLARYAVRPGATTPVEDLSLRLARGSIAGVARLDSGANHAGIVVTVEGTGLVASTDPLGAFRIDDVPAATGYTVIFRYDDEHTTEERTGVIVQAGQVTAIGSVATPVLLVTLQGGVGIAEGNYTNQRAVQLVLSFEGAVEYRASEDPGFADTAYRAFADGATGCVAQGGGVWRCPFTLADSDGLHRVHVQFRDPSGAGFESDVRSDTVTLDRVPPAAGSVELAGGAVAVKVLNVEATLASSDDNGLAAMMLSTDGSSYTSPVTFHSPVVQTYAGPEGSKCLHARFIDVAGNTSALPAAFDCVDYDLTPPTGSLAIVDQSGQDLTITSAPGAYLKVTASGASEMLLSSRSDFAGAAWQPVNTVDLQYWPFEPGQGTRTVYLALRDEAGNVAQGQPALQDSVQVDTVAPDAPVFTVQEGAFTNQLTIHLDLANPTPGETVLFESSRELGAVQSQPSTNTVAFALPALDGLHLLQVRYRDPAGNVSTASTASITLDRVGPLFAGVSCATCSDAAGQVISTQTAVTLLIQGGDAAQVRVSGDVASSTAWQAFTSLLAVTLSPGDGRKTVQVELRDAAGNPSTPDHHDLYIRVDSPAGGEPVTGTLVITGVDKDGASSARTRDRLVLASTAGFGDGVQGSGLTHLQISESATFVGAVWQECPLASSCNTDLPLVLSPGEGDKTVYVRVRDAANNVSSAVAASAIRLDTVAPSLSVLLEGQVAGGAPSNQFTRVASVAVRVTAVDGGSGLAPVAGLLKVSNNAAFAGASWRDLGDVTGWSIGSILGDGSKRVYVMVQDLAGNQTQADASILLDTRAPGSLYVVIDDGDLVTGTSGGHVLTLAAQDALSGVAEMCVSNAGSCSAWESFSDRKASWALASGAGTRAVNAWFRDAAGNESGPAGDDIQVDLVGPASASFSVEGFTGACQPGGSNWVTSTGVAVTLQAGDDLGVVDYKLAEDSDFGAVSWVPWPGPGGGPFAISHLLSSGDGPKVLGLRVRDAMGRTLDAASVCVTLDTQGPQLISVEILGGEYTQTPDVTVRVVAGDNLASGVNLKLILAPNLIACSLASYGLDFTGCTASTCTKDFAWTLNNAQGQQRVFACVKDAAGRSAGNSIDSVYLDLTDPPPIPDLQLVTGSRQVTASWSVVTDSGSGVDHYELNHAPTSDFSGARAQIVDTGAIASAEITGLDNRIPYYFRVRAVDKAGRPGPWSAVKQAVLGFAGVRLAELEHWRMFSNPSFSQPSLSTAGGRLWLTGTRATVMGIPWTLEVYTCDPRVADCRLPPNWHRVGGETTDLFVTGQTTPMRVPLVESGGRIYLAAPTTLSGVRRVMVWMCFADRPCLAGNDWASVQVEIDSDADVTNDISPSAIDMIATGSRVALVYMKMAASTYYPVMASCPVTKRCDATVSWAKAHVTTAPVANPVVGGSPTMESDGQRIWFAYRSSGNDIAVAYCNQLYRCDAATDFNTYAMGAPISGSAEYFPRLARTPQHLYLAWYSTSLGYRIRIERCATSTACNEASDWGASLTGEFINPQGTGDAVPALHLTYADSALQGTWWNENDGVVSYGYCLSPDVSDCRDPTRWTTFPLDQNVLLNNHPDVVWLGHNPVVAYQEDSGYVRLQFPRVIVPWDFAAAPGAGEFRAAWTGPAYLDGYHLLHDDNGPPFWANTLLLPDPLIERAQVNAATGAEQWTGLRSLFEGEVSDDSRLQRIVPFRSVVAVPSARSETVSCGGSGTECNYYTVAANATTIYVAYKYTSSPYNTYVSRCDHASTDCAQSGNWSTPVSVNAAAAHTPMLHATDTRVFLAEASAGSAVYYTSCLVSTGCDNAADWSAVLTLAGLGKWPALAYGNSRILMITIDGTNQLRAHFCLDSADCSLAGSWTQNVLVDSTAVWGSFDVVATGSGFTVAREYPSDVHYVHCRYTAGCESASDWSIYATNVFSTLANSPLIGSVRTAASTTPALQLVTSVHEGYLWVALCNFSTSTCSDAEQWSVVKLEPVTDLKGLTVQPRISNGVLSVLYATLNEVRLATCVRDCHLRPSWHIAPVLRSPELRESYGNRPVFSIVDGDKLVFGYTLDTTSNYPITVLWDGKAVPLE